ncbi:bifunctional enoyl-CoA hydratase/phosphate acetyltransferase [Desulfosporosinus sp. FKA]|uniref:bifunctional enoyl-CoA hydratase/phosphate acetyltransferase n=1 Tax=Desulfosporosinus sp. FKA TaxID=1969834 RepID=UPI00155479BC|nr:bifunctional enoyl-CoA hydratase/phosphate acetyltransferase [Desulfosporosinus sp. FKA]
MRYSGFESLLEKAKSMGRTKVAVAAAADKDVLEAIKLAEIEGLISPLLIGDEEVIKQYAAEIEFRLDQIELIHEPNPINAAHRAVDAVIDGQASFLMKGLINSSDFLRAVLRPERGLRTGRLLSHMAAFQIPGYTRLLFVTDGGMNIAPDLKQKKEILENSLLYLHGIGMELVNVIALTANEVVNPKMPATVDAKTLEEMNLNGEFPNAVVEGPLALDGAVSAAALKHKGISSRINGNVDLFLVPSIEVGNVLGKSLVYFAGATMAGIILGAQVPIVLTSRNDTPRSKLMALTMAALSQKGQRLS